MIIIYLAVWMLCEYRADTVASFIFFWLLVVIVFSCILFYFIFYNPEINSHLTVLTLRRYLRKITYKMKSIINTSMQTDDGDH